MAQGTLQSGCCWHKTVEWEGHDPSLCPQSHPRTLGRVLDLSLPGSCPGKQAGGSVYFRDSWTSDQLVSERTSRGPLPQHSQDTAMLIFTDK